MNTSMIRYTLGHVLRLEGLFLILPLIIALMYQEQSGVYFLIVAIICFLVGLLLSFRKPKNTGMHYHFPQLDCIKYFRLSPFCSIRGDSGFYQCII